MKMLSPIYIFFLTFFHIIKNFCSQGSPGDILGPTACDIYTMDYNDCGTPDVPVKILPKNCSSYLYMNIFVENITVYDEGEKLSTIPGYLDQLIQTNITVLVYYYHAHQAEWCAALQSDAATQTAEINNLKCFLDQHPGVKGIILRALMVLGEGVITTTQCPDYTENLKKYIELMHKTFPNLSIGILITSMRDRELYNTPGAAWLNYTCLDTSVDFYVVNFQNLNKCSEEFTKTGIYPLCGNNNNTLNAMITFLNDMGVSSDKVHYNFYNYGDPKNENESCGTQPITYCKNVQDAKTSMCMDTLQTLYEKGAFAKKNGAGFIVNTIDSDDYDGNCQCGRSFPGFYALLNGYNGAPPPEPCALFDRT